MAIYQLNATGVLKDGTINIPSSADNRHWAEYLDWLAAGNTPDPADPVIPPHVPTVIPPSAATSLPQLVAEFDALVLELKGSGHLKK